jgi:serine/threonine-protein kinase RsbW
VTEPQLVVRRIERARGGGAELALDVPSDVRLVGEAVELLTGHLVAGPLSPRRLRFNLRTALAEALTNAIVYGNGEDPGKVVRVRVEWSRVMVRIYVTDDGDGFDPGGLPDPTRPEHLLRETGRGLFVIRHLVDDVGFNAKGNAICLTLRAD